ncbi:MAG: pyridoxal 5'-phosphate synthase lyase subunit PdxS, partial [Candidatus Bathyarchaeia archaeon]
MVVNVISLVAAVKQSKGLCYGEVEGVEVRRGTVLVKRGFAHMLKHGVIMDVTSVEQAQIAE